jgi:membrane protein DedA with SNARE-associated domain
VRARCCKMLNWLIETIGALGYVGIALLAFLENIIPPIPSEAIVPAAGYAAARGELTLFGVIVAATLGSLVGALPLFALGYWVGEKRLIALADRYGAWVTVNGADIERSVQWFARHGINAVFLARLVPGVRSLISIPAGITHMKLLPFVIFTAAGSSIWTAVLAVLGYGLGENHEAIKGVLEPISRVVVIGGAIFTLCWIAWRWQAQRKARVG